MSSAPILSGFALADISLFLAGQLPKEVGDFANLRYFNVEDNMLEGERTRTERLRMFADLFLPLSIQGSYPRSSANLSI